MNFVSQLQLTSRTLEFEQEKSAEQSPHPMYRVPDDSQKLVCLQDHEKAYRAGRTLLVHVYRRMSECRPVPVHESEILVSNCSADRRTCINSPYKNLSTRCFHSQQLVRLKHKRYRRHRIATPDIVALRSARVINTVQLTSMWRTIYARQYTYA